MTTEEQEAIDIDPNDTATIGFTFTTNLTFTLPSLPIGLTTLNVSLSNEVSSVVLNVTVS